MKGTDRDWIVRALVTAREPAGVTIEPNGPGGGTVVRVDAEILDEDTSDPVGVSAQIVLTFGGGGRLESVDAVLDSYDPKRWKPAEEPK